MPEADIIELFADKDKILYLYIPSSGQLFYIDIGEEIEDNPYDMKLKQIGQYNLDDLDELENG